MALWLNNFNNNGPAIPTCWALVKLQQRGLFFIKPAYATAWPIRFYCITTGKLVGFLFLTNSIIEVRKTENSLVWEYILEARETQQTSSFLPLLPTNPLIGQYRNWLKRVISKVRLIAQPQMGGEVGLLEFIYRKVIQKGYSYSHNKASVISSSFRSTVNARIGEKITQNRFIWGLTNIYNGGKVTHTLLNLP